MYDLTEKELLDNYNKLLQVVEEHFTGERKEKILKMYEFFQDNIEVIILFDAQYPHPQGYRL